MNKEYCTFSFLQSAGRLAFATNLWLLFSILFSGQPALLQAAETGILEGRILNVAEEPVDNAEVYVFDSPDVKRPADFISNRTGRDGQYQVQLPPGNYWAVAIFRQSGGRFGPLTYGDKHSGEALALEIGGGDKHSLDFVVVNLREAARQHQKKSADLIRLRGRILSESGTPVVMAYAMAHKMERFGILPDYLSTWTDEEGNYTLYLPPGSYYLGASLGFPPEHGYNLKLNLQFEEDTDKVDLIIDGVKMK